MQKIEEDNEENSTQVSEEIDDAPGASAVQKEEDSQKDEISASFCTANRTFICKCAMYWRSKNRCRQRRKACNIVCAIQAYEMTQRYV